MSDVLFTKSQNIARITLNRPKNKNALTNAMCADIATMIGEINTDKDIRVVLLNANGNDFTVGADLKDLSSALPTDSKERSEKMSTMVRDLSWPIFLGLDQLPQPLIVSARGHTIGAGAQMVLSADLCVAGSSLKFLLPQVRLAHSVDHGESYFLPRKVGMARAMQLTLLAETLNADDAEKYGLVNWVTSDKDLEDKTEQVVQAIAANAPIASREIKTLMRQSMGNSINEQFLAESTSLERCAASDDFVEAMTAFMQKRKPVFKGH